MSTPWYRRFNPFSSEAESPLAVTDEADAQNNLGVLHSCSTGSGPDLAAALECFRRAAGMGHAVAQNNLGMMLATGQGIARDAEAAGVWLLRSANQGDASAQFNLGARCHRANVRGLTADASEGRTQALMWFQLSANQGYRKAEEWCERLTLDMTASEVDEARRRAAAFVARKEQSTEPVS